MGKPIEAFRYDDSQGLTALAFRYMLSTIEALETGCQKIWSTR